LQETAASGSPTGAADDLQPATECGSDIPAGHAVGAPDKMLRVPNADWIQVSTALSRSHVRLCHQKDAGSTRDSRTTEKAQLRRAVENARDLQKIRLWQILPLLDVPQSPGMYGGIRTAAKAKTSYISYTYFVAEGVSSTSN
jgi:hypothetical protein